MQLVIAKNKKFIYLGIASDDDVSLSWEQLQKIKDDYFPELAFVEVYPVKNRIINKANERHLFHIIGGSVPDLADLETESEIKIIEL